MNLMEKTVFFCKNNEFWLCCILRYTQNSEPIVFILIYFWFLISTRLIEIDHLILQDQLITNLQYDSNYFSTWSWFKNAR